MGKGIRVNQLAKELGIESKAILAKLGHEGLADKAPNHMSTLPLGLAESVREWFKEGDHSGGTAVETAAPVATATKPRTRASRKKKDEHPAAVVEVELPVPPVAEPVVEPVITSVAEPVEEVAPPVVEVAPAPVVEIPPAPPAPPAAPEPVVAAETVVAPPAPLPAEPVAPITLPPESPAAAIAAPEPLTAAPAAPAAPHHEGGARAQRPTVTLASRAAAAAPPAERKPAPPAVKAPQLTALMPAKIQGPRIVSIGKEETIDTRGPRQVRRQAESTGVTPAMPRGGRGVRVTEDEETEEAKKKANAKKGGSLSSRRRGVDGRRGEAMEKLKEFTDADLIARRDALNAAASSRNVFDSHLRQVERRGTHAPAKSAVERGEVVSLEEPITVKSLSAAIGIKSNEIISKLMKQGIFANVNQTLDTEVASAMALEFGVEVKVAAKATLEETMLVELDQRTQDPAKLQIRPPVVTILGHVDHGKTSLLDKIRNANVAAGEAGGITQHTAAWMVRLGEKRVTFIDTPGHQAFTSMRAGANMTDVVVLVVSAAEGVQPQTVESINHARAANVPIVVAMNKIDRPDANPDMVLGQLAKEGLNPIEWGGDTEVVRTSATTGEGVPALIEILDLQSQLMELKADPTAPARGTVIESRVDEGLGLVATVLIQNGTLKLGDIGLAGTGYGRIRSLVNDRGEMIQEAGPSTPVIVSGLNNLPDAGDKFFALDDMEKARNIAEERQMTARQFELSQTNRVTLDNLFQTMQAGDVKTINLIIKGDVQGSVETLAKSVTDANTEEVKVHVIHSAVGAINESDIQLADASKAVVIGFHVTADEPARQMAEQRKVEIRLYRVIYEIFDDLKKALSGLLEPEIREKLHGHAEIRKVYKVSRIGSIAGCMVTDGHIQRGSRIRLIRNGVVITQDLSLESLKRLKDDVREVKSGLECGIKLANYDDIKEGDVLEAYIRETFQRTL